MHTLRRPFKIRKTPQINCRIQILTTQSNPRTRQLSIDTSAGNFDLRLGKQNIVWGEMVGLFFADVVSARDLRDFILPDFETIRIPQWAARAEYFGEESHFEVIWLPYPSVDEIGKPGAEFYPLHAPTTQIYKDQRTERSNLAWRAPRETVNPWQAEWDVRRRAI